MAGLGIRVFTDEMVSPRLAHRLVAQFYDVVCCRDRGRSNKRIPDSEQLKYASQEGRAIFTFNATEFAAIHQIWLSTGNTHSGIIISEEIDDIAELERRVKRHLDMVDPQAQSNHLIRLL
jgi:predicted nuclease of predicted toxin-antitoxin system